LTGESQFEVTVIVKIKNKYEKLFLSIFN